MNEMDGSVFGGAASDQGSINVSDGAKCGSSQKHIIHCLICGVLSIVMIPHLRNHSL